MRIVGSSHFSTFNMIPIELSPRSVGRAVGEHFEISVSPSLRVAALVGEGRMH
jgi:hypothetical protein